MRPALLFSRAAAVVALLSAGAALAQQAAPQPAQKTIFEMDAFDGGDIDYRTHLYVQFKQVGGPTVLMVPGDGLSGKSMRDEPDGSPGWSRMLYDAGYNVFALDNVGCGEAIPPPSDDLVVLMEKALYGVYQAGMAAQPTLLIAHEQAAGMALKARSLDEQVADTLVLIDPIGPQGTQPMSTLTPEQVLERWQNRDEWNWHRWGFGPELGKLRKGLDLTPVEVDSLIRAYDDDQPAYWTGLLTPMDSGWEIREALHLEGLPVLVIRTPAADREQITREEALVSWMTEHGLKVDRLDLSQDPKLRNVSGLPWTGSLAGAVLDRILQWYSDLGTVPVPAGR